MTATITQTDGVLALLHAQGQDGLTPIDALNRLGCFRLAARIAELRADGWVIENRGKGHARYVLIAEATPWKFPVAVAEAEQRSLWGDR
jgi:hypothetical protein